MSKSHVKVLNFCQFLLSCSSQRIRLKQINQLIKTNLESIKSFEEGVNSVSSIVANAQSGYDAATTDSERDYWTQWLNMITSEIAFYRKKIEMMRAKQVVMETEKGQLEASIIANCGGLDATDAPSGGNS